VTPRNYLINANVSHFIFREDILSYLFERWILKKITNKILFWNRVCEFRTGSNSDYVPLRRERGRRISSISPLAASWRAAWSTPPYIPREEGPAVKFAQSYRRCRDLQACVLHPRTFPKYWLFSACGKEGTWMKGRVDIRSKRMKRWKGRKGSFALSLSRTPSCLTLSFSFCLFVLYTHAQMRFISRT